MTFDEPKSKFRIHVTHVTVLIALFISLRLLFLLNFPIFNDEAIYIQYAQIIHADWDRFKFISINNIFGDWKPPLIYWICSLFIGLFDNPLLTARLLAVAASLIGLFSVYAFAGYYFDSRKIAFWSGLFWTLNPMVLFYDREFVAETFVYSFAAATYLFAYLAVSKNKWNALPAILLGTLALLSKQTAQLNLLGLLLFAFLQIKIKPRQQPGRRIEVNSANLLLILLITALPFALYRVVIPSEYFQAYDKFSSQFMFNVKELAQFPTEVWMENIKRIGNLFLHYYSPLAVILVLVFLYQCVTRRNARDLLLLAWFLFFSCVIVFVLKNFNEYIYHTATVFFLSLMIGMSAEHLGKSGANIFRTIPRYLVQFGVSCLLILVWAYSLAYYYASPRDYIKKFGSPWMKENYYLGWASGFGVNEVLSLLEKEQYKTVLLDPQWGNPGTGIMVLSKSFTLLKFVRMTEPLIKDLDSMPPNTVITAFKYRPDRPGPPLDSEVAALKICNNMIVLQWEKDQVPLIVCKN